MILGLLVAVSAIPSSGWLLHPHTGSIADILPRGGELVCATTGGVIFGTVVDEGAIRWDSSWVYPGDLGHANCRCLASSPDGSIWVGTWGGGIDMYRPDGHRVHFGQLEGLPIAQRIRAILPDSSIFAGTTEGLSIMEYGYFQTWTELNTGRGLPDDNVTSLISSDSGLFVGTESGIAMLRADGYPGSPSSWVGFPEMDGKKLNELAWCSDTLWAAAEDGLFFLPPGGAAWTKDASFPFEKAFCIASDGTSLAVGSGWLSVVREGGVWSYKSVWGGQDVKAVAFGPGGLVYAGLTCELDVDDMGMGVGVRWGGWYRVTTPPGIPSCSVHSVSLDDGGTCWITTENIGAAVLLDGTWISYTSVLPGEHQVFASETQADGSVFIAPYACGAAWLSNAGTPDTADDEVIAFDITNSGLLSNRILAVHRAVGGQTWFGQIQVASEEASGVTRLVWEPGNAETARWTSWTAAGGLPSGAVQAVFGLPDGSAWVGTASGLTRVGPGQQEVSKVMNSSDGLPSDEITALVLTRTGRLYAGTSSGLGLVEPGASTASEVAGVDGAVSALVEDNAGAVWAATDKALFRILPNGRLEEYNTLNCPILSTVIKDLACDRDRGILYIGTDHGMWTVDLGGGLSGDGGSATLYPNPFHPGDGEVLGVAGLEDIPTEIRVFDLTGSLVYEFAAPDRDGIAWNGADMDGRPAPSGIYVVQIIQDGFEALTGLALVR